jgi:hypothetical protein
MTLTSFKADNSNPFLGDKKSGTSSSIEDNTPKVYTLSSFKELVIANQSLEEFKPFSVITEELKELDSYQSFFNCAAVISHNNSTWTMTQRCHEISASGLSNNGLSGWFLFSGAFKGHGDFNGDLENCGMAPSKYSEFEAMQAGSNFELKNGNIVVTSLDRAAHDRLFLDGNLIVENQGSSYIISNLAPRTYAVLAEGFDRKWGQECEKPLTFTINEVVSDNDCQIIPPADLNLTCIDALSPDFTGYPTINCDSGGSCARAAGYHELNYETFAGSTSDWSFDPGWQIGSGYTPSCDLAPNAYIDFTNFKDSYDRSLTSPVFDACCMDNIQIDYCVRSDLFTNDLNNAPIQYLDVQYKIGNGNWITINTHESVDGETNDFNENDLNIPEAAGEQLRIRFRAYGNGGHFTLGGWGVDQLRVEGNSSGCTTPLTPSDYDLTYVDSKSGGCPKVIVRTWTATPNNSADNCTSETLVNYNMDACTSSNSNGTNYDYSEFTPTYPNAANCVNVSASGVYRNSGAHSCIAGQGGSTAAAGFEVDGLNYFHDNSPKAIRFEVTINPQDFGRLTALKFHEMAPDYFDHLSGNSGTNNYPQKYGVRVLKNGVEVFKQINLNTTQSWTLENFDFSNDPNFEISSTSTFQFELLSYDAVGNGGQISEWDIDGIQIEGCCGSGLGSEVLTATQIITINDQVAPDLVNVPADITIICDAVPAPPTVGANDNCDNNVTVTLAEVRTDGDCPNNYTLTRTWTATDNCGNTSNDEQVLTVIDAAGPEILDIPASVTVECDEFQSAPTLQILDNCDASATISLSEEMQLGVCDDNYTVIRTWTATDACGNITTAIQVTTVTDTTSPILTGIPANATVECDAIIASVNPTASDNCDNDVTIQYQEISSQKNNGSCADHLYTLTRIWKATDNCGNVDIQQQVITVGDTTDPVLGNLPTDQTVECDDLFTPAILTVSDNCDENVDITFSETSTKTYSGVCTDDTYIITRTWVATDNCGNIDSYTQTINVQDTTDPILIDVPTKITVECDAVPALAQPTASDNCDVYVTIIFNEVRVDGNCVDNYILERTWTATDNCGNNISSTQIITVQDTTDPELIGVPADVTIECDLVPTPAVPQAIDNCDDDVDITFNEVKTDGNCTDNYILTRTWTATDNCGNTAVKVQVITVQGTNAPNIYDIPASVTVECDAIPAVSTAPFANDNCDDDVAITFAEVRVDGSCEDSYTLTRTWTATDNCGNTDSGIQIITVKDTTDPILVGVPAAETVECSVVPVPAQPTATDNCEVDITIDFQEVKTDGNCTGNYTLTRTWIATDNCGNTDVEVQVITVQNTTDPELFGVPSDATVECDAIPPPAIPTASDNCNVDVNISFEVEIVPGTCPDSYLMIRKWIATNNCGNQDIQIQNITVQDTTDPTLSGVPANVTVECNAVPTLANPTAEDNCDPNPTVTFNEVKTDGGCVDSYVLKRTWTATDACGNESTAAQEVSVTDTEAPSLWEIPADLTVECNDILGITSNPIATDNCDVDVDILFNETNTPGVCADTYTLTRTWTATDNCGNTTEAVQTIFVQDITDPTLIGVPNNLTVDLTQGQTIPTAPILIGVDNCDTDVAITFEENPIGSGCSYTLERTWTATDNCGNTISATQIIEVIGELNVTETHVDATCGENNGSIALTVDGGLAPITFVWSNGVGNLEDLNDLAPSIYEVTVTDGTGCSTNLAIEIIGSGALQVDISATIVSCFEGNDGSINLSVVIGLAPFTYDWTGGIGNIPNPTNLTAGSYNVTITAANGCSVSTSTNVNQPQALAVTIDSNSGGCVGGLGSATANVEGGTAPYQYVWSTGAAAATINDLVAGTYTVTITDGNGCMIEDEVTISASSNLIISIDQTAVNCYLGNDGTAAASAIGGQPDFIYLWSNGETAATIVNLAVGTYTVTITDGIGCTGSQTTEIISPPELQLTTVSTEVSSIGNDGTAIATATGGILPYQYVWSNGQMNPTITGLSVGTYTVTVIDDNGCFEVDQVEIISTVTSGDVGIGDYVWFDTNRDGIQDANEIGLNNVMVKLLTAGLDGTFGTLDDAVVATETTSNNPQLTGAGYYLFENVLPGTYQIEFMPSSLPNDYIFTLENQGGNDNLDSDANPLTGSTTTFTVVAGQLGDLSFDAGIHPECNNINTGGAIEATQTICAGDTPDLFVNSIYPTGGGGDLEYIWLMNTTGSPFSNTDPAWTIIQGSINEFYQSGQIYTNTYFIRCVRRAGCTDFIGESNIVVILVTPLPNIQIEQAPSSLCVNESTSFQAAYAGATATYLWDFGAGASTQTSTQINVYNLTYSTAGTKTVILTVENMGCSISITHELEVVNCLNNFGFTDFAVAPTPNNTEVLLSWATRYEVNSSSYYLEHSKNGDDFEVFELRNANGSTPAFNNYQGIHAEPYYGVNYYRVKYVATDGQATYSRVAAVVFDNGTRDIYVYPNPVVDFTYVEFLTELTEDATIEVVNMAGKVLHTEVVTNGFRTYRVSLVDYPAGTYLIWVRYNVYRKDVELVVKITE